MNLNWQRLLKRVAVAIAFQVLAEITLSRQEAEG